MAVAFHPGQGLGEDDLNIIIRDSTGILVDPFYIRYSLFDFTTGVEVLIGAPDRIPATSGTGLYYVNATIPADANIGDWVIRWNFRATVADPLVQVVQEFNIVKETVQISITGSSVQDGFLRRLRILLRDNNPDRNYRFRPPSHEKFLQAQTQVFGYVWEDHELYECLLMAIDDFNGAPPITDVALDDMPTRWRTTILMRAASFACFMMIANWIVDEFSVKGEELVTVRDGSGEEYTIPVSELFDIVYSDMMREIEKRAREEFLVGVEEMSNETD